MVSVARPWLICDYHGLIVTKCFLVFFICIKLCISIHQVELLYKVISMFIKTSFVITIISDLLTLMIIPIQTFECNTFENPCHI